MQASTIMKLMFDSISDSLKARASKIKLVGFDVDGVLTDGGIFINENGEAFKRFHSLDGHGFKMLINFGIIPCIISARKSIHVHKRFEKYGFDDVITGEENKLHTFEHILMKHNIEMDEAAFIGDDILDTPVLEQVGLAVCPPGAHFSVKKHIHYITEHKGGFGAAREFIDLILYCQGKIPV